jgi:ABC-type transport system involved in multi-copper enzyme maturation permease subunit
MFAEFILQTEYATLSGVGQVFVFWLKVVGVISMVMLAIWELMRLAMQRGSSFTHGLGGTLTLVPPEQAWRRRGYGALVIAAGAGLLLALGVRLITSGQQGPSPWAERLFLLACASAIGAISWEFLMDVLAISPRRVWAVARLSMKEAIRGKALWGFGVLLLVFLFASWFVPAKRPENQWRLYVDLVYKLLLALMVIISSVLAAFSLPTDIRRQTIHTIVTKPVLRLEVLLGRILGVGVLMSAVLLVVSHLSLLYVFREIDPKARDQTMRARVYNLGDLKFEMMNAAGQWERREKGEDVGRVFEYRSHIRGGDPHEAVWRFTNLPPNFRDPQWLKDNESVVVEFNFDIMRMTRDREERGGGVYVFIKFINTNRWKGTSDEQNRYREMKNPEKPSEPARGSQRADAFGYFELESPIQVLDYHTHRVEFPTALLKDMGERGELEVRVACRSHGQYLGMAKHDLYLVTREASFYANFLKGTLGIWAVTIMVIAIATVFATQFNGLISLILTWVLLFLGSPVVRAFIFGLAQPPSEADPNAGPFEAMFRLVQGLNQTTPLEESTLVIVLKGIDRGVRLFFSGILNVLPDLYQYDRTLHVAEGFNIPADEISMSVLLLAGYLLPFFMVGYYLFLGREVAR